MAKPRPLVSVYVDIARLVYEVGKVPHEKRGDWLSLFVESLALRDPSIHQYGAHLMSEAEAFMVEKSEKTRRAAESKWGLNHNESGNKTRSERLAEARKIATHRPEEWAGILNFIGCCCRCRAIGVELVKDHIIPIYQGGSDGIDNLQPLCKSCNSSKGPEHVDYRPDGWKNACATHLTPPFVGVKCLQMPATDRAEQSSSEQNKTTPPPFTTPTDAEVLDVLKAYPKSRAINGGGEERVHIGEADKKSVATFMSENPTYPLLFAVQHYGKSTKRPKDLRNWLQNPPALERVLADKHRADEAETERKINLGELG